MTESMLKALMRLFAIVSLLLPDDKKANAEDIVESYLLQLVGSEKLDQYISIYRFYYNDFAERTKKQKEKIQFFSVKSLLICEQINKVLLQNEKMLLYLQLIDILKYKNHLTELENDYIKTLALSLNFSEDIYHNCRAFIFDSIQEIPDKESVLLIDCFKKTEIEGIKHWQLSHLRGNIVFLFIKETENFFFRHNVSGDQLLLSGRKVMPDRTYNFDKGSVLRSALIGTVHYSDILKFFFGHKSDLEFVFEAMDLEYKFKQGEQGIYPFSVSIDSGQLVGIMGGSGTGKSTLMNLLNSNLVPTGGKVLINGINVHHDKNILHGTIGYIPQEDLLIEELSVYQNLYFNAKLCFNNLSETEINKRVMDLLTDLDLYDIKDLRVGGVLNKLISGGQRKRLNISLELIREPYLLFVDEPTSGLSSTDSEMVMDLLKEQALKGKLVMTNIHQPSSDIFKLFDKLLVMDKGGRIVYYGNPIDAPVYFKTTRQLINAEDSECITCGNLNPEQILQIVEAEKTNELGKPTGKRIITSELWYDLYKKNLEPLFKKIYIKKKKVPPGLLNLPDKFKQFRIFSLRNLLSKLTDKQYIIINLVEAPLLALILGIFTRYNSGSADSENAYVFLHNVNLPVFIFMSVIVALFLGMMVSAEEIIRDRKIIQREAFLNLSKFSYYNSKVVFLLALSAIQTLLFVLIGNWMLGIKGMMLPYWLVLFSASVFSNILGLNISDSLKSVVSIYILIPILLVPQILLGGAMIRFDKLNKQITSQQYVPVIGDVMASRWAYEALAVYQFTNNRYQKHFYQVEKKESEASYRVNYYIPELQLLLDDCTNYLTKENQGSNLKKTLKILIDEVSYLSASDQKIPVFPEINSLTPGKFNADVADKLKVYLHQVNNYYLRTLDLALDEKDRIIADLGKRFGGKEKIVMMRQKYYNENLAELVLNKRDNDKIIQYKSRLVQKAEPVFAIPESRIGRAQFYAPVKRIGSITISTFWFNVAFLWLMNIVFYLFLQYGIIKRGVAFLGTSSFKQE